MRVRHVLSSGAAVALVLAGCGEDGDRTEDAALTATSARVTAADVAAGELVTGDCVAGLVIGAAERRTIDSAQVVDCESAHELEVFATFELSPDDFPEVAEDVDDSVYPGENRVVTAADEACAEHLEELGVEDGIGMIAIWPTNQSWALGDRGVTCAAFSEDGQPFQGRRLLQAEAEAP